ncbi:MAG: WD40 repeat domain-containing protein, partial [Rubrivivax sp.]
ELSFDAQAQHVATMHQDARGLGTIRVRSLPALQETGRIPIDHRPKFALSPDGSLLAVSGRVRGDERSPWRLHVDLFDVAGAQPRLRLAEDRSLTWLQFSPDGRHLLSVGDSFGDQARELRVWRLSDGQLVASLRHETDIQYVRIGMRGDELATRTGGQIRVWGLPSGSLLSQIEADTGFKDFTFSPDSQRLLTGGADGSVVLWLWRSEDLRDEACRRLTRNLDADEWARYLGDRPYRSTCQNPAAVLPSAALAVSAPRR